MHGVTYFKSGSSAKEYTATLLYGIMIRAEFLHSCVSCQFEVCHPAFLWPSIESSVHEGSTGNDNDGSVCGSDSAFYKQSEGKRRGDERTQLQLTALSFPLQAAVLSRSILCRIFSSLLSVFLKGHVFAVSC